MPHSTMLRPVIVRIASVLLGLLLPFGHGLLDPAATRSAEREVADGGITVIRQLAYRERSKSCTLDLAMPQDRSGKPRPTMVVIHGGGWLEGDKSSFVEPSHPMPGNILDFARLGFVAVAINYRMSGEAPFPAALEDCQCAVRWLRAHAGEYHVDVDHIGAYGNSAGGHLALLLGVPQLSTRVAASEPHADQSSWVQAAVSDSGPLDLAAQHAQNQLRFVIEKLMGGPPEGARAAEYARASPSSYPAATICPLLLIYGAADSQVDVKTADCFVAALGQAGHLDLSYVRLAGVDHCPHSLVRIPYLQHVVEQFFLRTLRPDDAKKP